MNTFTLEIITPDRSYPERTIVMLNVPAEDGRLAVLAHHAPLVCSILSGTVQLMAEDGRNESWQVGSGTLSVEGNAATLLVRDAAPPHEPEAPSTPLSSGP